MPHLSKSIIIPDNALMNIEIIDTEYVVYENILIAPSKGNISRNINPNEIPWIFNGIYQENEYYPTEIVSMREPYILRDFRGQTIVFTPFQYNVYLPSLLTELSQPDRQ